MNSKEVKMKAKEILGESKKKLVLITFLSLVIPSIPTFILNATGLSLTVPILALIVALAVLVVQRGFIYAVTKTYVARKNGEENFENFGFISEGFSDLKRAWALSFRLLPKYIVPILCYIVTVVFSIVSLLGSGEMFFGKVTGIVNIVLYIVTFALIIRTTYTYRYADIEAINNPDLTPKEVIGRTGEVMVGNRMRSFKLDLSLFLYCFGMGFLGGLLGGLIPLVGSLITNWFVANVQVSLMMAHIVLYDDISGSSFDVIPDYMRDRNVEPDPFNY